MTASRLQRIDELVRQLSYQDDPDRLIRLFTRQSSLIFPHDALLTVSRRDLDTPCYRITRSWRWADAINPWTEAYRLPRFDRGLPGELLYRGKPALLNRLEVNADDPTREHFEGMHALIAAPAYDQGRALHMALALRRQPDSFTADDLETLLLNANLLSQAAANLMLAQQLQEAYRQLDYEQQQVGRMQRHLLPAALPRVEGLELAASYVTCSQAGGDYYDVLPLEDGRWALFVADVSGHGTPAAVMMAMLHTLLHSWAGPLDQPRQVFAHLNHHLLKMAPEGMFATAIHGVYAPAGRRLRYAIAGHPAPLLRRGLRAVESVPETEGVPLGILASQTWTEAELKLTPGDALLLYTDGVLEGTNRARVPFGRQRLEEALRLGPMRAAPLVQHIERLYRDHCGDMPDFDDRTLLAVVAAP